MVSKQFQADVNVILTDFAVDIEDAVVKGLPQDSAFDRAAGAIALAVNANALLDFGWALRERDANEKAGPVTFISVNGGYAEIIDDRDDGSVFIVDFDEADNDQDYVREKIRELAAMSCFGDDTDTRNELIVTLADFL